MPISAPDAMNPAFAHTKQQLLQPFRFTQWARLAFVGLLAGEMSSGGGCNTNINLPSWPGGPPASPHMHTAFLPTQWTSQPVLVAGSVAILTVVVLALLVLLTYVSSVMRFILFDSVIAKECHIRQSWARRQRPALRLFVWQILFMLVTSAALVIVIGFPAACAWALGWLAHARDHVLELALAGLTVFLVLIVLFVIAAMVHVMTKDFVVPQMALEEISTVEGWRRLWLSLKSDRAGYAGYVGMKIVLAIGAAILFGIITAIAILILLIPIGGAGIIAVLGGRAAGWTWNLHTIALAVIFACVALAIFTFVATLISVPVVVFFPAYSIYFFAPRYPPLASLLWRQPSAPAWPG